MKFPYDMYYKIHFESPLLFTCIFLVAIILGLISLFSGIFRKGGSEISEQQIVFMWIFLSVLFFELLVHSTPLLRGGFYLISEKEKDAVVVSCKIEDIREMEHLTGGDVSTACRYIVFLKGMYYYLPSTEGLEVGDSVSAVVLPRSRFVLSICKDES